MLSTSSNYYITTRDNRRSFSKTFSSKQNDAVDISEVSTFITDTLHVFEDDTLGVIGLENAGNNQYYLTFGDKYLYSADANALYVSDTNEETDDYKWTINVASNNDISLINVAWPRQISLNTSTGGFRAYKTTTDNAIPVYMFRIN